ncbi:hypothetical protein [Flavihumibacter petaseus]|uniref:Uncharacterized protein n=1 Tax=Flavihumibacter petaseus NBRC 106054 TaxID=1220578 RepID=A0A0E9N264_9BACT|nr:hypothetical protein [Flavihumibacter petaseus]GAO44122.1 hypothetical protein FPE01S_03_01610 [Flavihumibacter petaseus NBRC 106054]
MRKYSVLVVLSFWVIYFLFFATSDSEAACNFLHEFKKVKFSGVVEDKFVDYSQHSYRIVLISDKLSGIDFRLRLDFDTTNAFGIINVGDEIRKDSGSNIIFRLVNGDYAPMSPIDFGCMDRDWKK